MTKTDSGNKYVVYTNYSEEVNRLSKADTVYVDSESDDIEGSSNTWCPLLETTFLSFKMK